MLHHIITSSVLILVLCVSFLFCDDSVLTPTLHTHTLSLSLSLCMYVCMYVGLNYGTQQYRQRYNDGYTGGVNLSYNGYSQQTNVARGRGRLGPYSVC